VAELWPNLLWPYRSLRYPVRPNAAKLRGLKHLQRGEIPKISHPLQLVEDGGFKRGEIRRPREEIPVAAGVTVQRRRVTKLDRWSADLIRHKLSRRASSGTGSAVTSPAPALAIRIAMTV
jgi:hypothetical protein